MTDYRHWNGVNGNGIGVKILIVYFIKSCRTSSQGIVALQDISQFAVADNKFSSSSALPSSYIKLIMAGEELS